MKSNNARPASSRVERDLLDALDRLMQGKPRHEILRRRTKAGKLRIGINAVAMEAGHSRTLIGKDACAYPGVRAKVLATKGPPKGRKVTGDYILAQLRQENQLLKIEKRTLATQLADAINVVDRLELEIERLKRRQKLQSRRTDGDTNNVVDIEKRELVEEVIEALERRRRERPRGESGPGT